MSVMRAVVALIAIVAVAVAATMLGWPQWIWAPVGGSVLVAVGYVVAVVYHGNVAVAGRRTAGRADVAAVAGATLAVTLTLVLALIGPDRIGPPVAAARGESADDTGPDRAVTQLATRTVTTLFTFGPADVAPGPAQRRAQVLEPVLTGRLLADYRNQGPDVVVASAVSTGASCALEVTALGVAESDRHTMRLLMFGTQTLTLPEASPPRATVPIARWVVMRRVDGTWRLADLYPVGVGG